MISFGSPGAKRWFSGQGILGGVLAVLLVGTAATSGLTWPLWAGLPGTQPVGLLLTPKEPARDNAQGYPTASEDVQEGNSSSGPKGTVQEPARPTHPLIQALLDTLEAFQGEGTEAKDALRGRLEEADRQLHTLLSGRKEKILQANRKPVLPLIEERISPQADRAKKVGPTPSPEKVPTQQGPSSGKSSLSVPKPPVQSTPAGQASKISPPTSEQQEAETPLVRALLDTLDALPEIPEQEKRRLRTLLLEADQELAQRPKSPSGKIPAPSPSASPSRP